MKRTLAFVACISVAAMAHGESSTPDEVLAYAKAKDSQSAREKYFSCWEKSNASGYAQVETGSVKWLQVATQLLKDSDGCYSLGLKDSIARALIAKPENVLPLVDSARNLEASSICVPFMADETDPAKVRSQLDTLRRLELALKRVSRPELQTQKKKCLLIVQSLQKDIGAAPTSR